MILRLTCRSCGRPFVGEISEEGDVDAECGNCEVSFDLWNDQLEGVRRGL